MRKYKIGKWNWERGIGKCANRGGDWEIGKSAIVDF